MRFDRPLIAGRLLSRYKRFLADVQLPDGSVITAHTPNTGSMQGCADPGSTAWLRDTANPDRKYPYSWEMVTTLDGVIVGIHTGYANTLVAEAIENGVIAELQGYGSLKREVTFANSGSRFDVFLSQGTAPDCYVEVKNVTLVDKGVAMFPDAVTARGAKHLRHLAEVVAGGGRAVLCFCVQREDAEVVRAASHIDPLYAATLAQVAAAGVEVLAYQASLSPEEIKLVRRLPVQLG
ncbi:MAG: DNA/RNA nuclease SfsA [Gammaproteobacteria bacterium]|nr:DNA/RNA nuclease SfsA [Gammaproteobacteria bacterium]